MKDFINLNEKKIVDEIFGQENFFSMNKLAYQYMNIATEIPYDEHFYIVSIYKGRGSFIDENQNQKLSANSMIILNPEHKHNAKFESPIDSKISTILLTREEIDRFLRIFKEKDKRIIDDPLLEKPYEFEFKKICYKNVNYLTELTRNYFIKDASLLGFNYMKELQLYEILCYLINNELKKEQNRKLSDFDNTLKTELKRKLQIIIDFLNDNYTEDVKIEQLSQMIALNKYYFIKLFKTFTGYTPYDYLVKIRMEHAKNLLSKSNISVNELALNLGYSSFSSFSRAFKAYTGYSPSEYRMQLL